MVLFVLLLIAAYLFLVYLSYICAKKLCWTSWEEIKGASSVWTCLGQVFVVLSLASLVVVVLGVIGD